MPASDWWSHMPWLGMFMMPVMMIIFVIIVLLVIVPLMRSIMGPSWHGQAPYPPTRTALDILNERFARGEIDKAEYEEKKRLIS
jgi:putative membrane protein